MNAVITAQVAVGCLLTGQLALQLGLFFHYHSLSLTPQSFSDEIPTVHAKPTSSSSH
jgi:hypothetical protein